MGNETTNFLYDLYIAYQGKAKVKFPVSSVTDSKMNKRPNYQWWIGYSFCPLVYRVYLSTHGSTIFLIEFFIEEKYKFSDILEDLKNTGQSQLFCKTESCEIVNIGNQLLIVDTYSDKNENNKFNF